MIRHDRLISFAVSAMFTSAFLASAPSVVVTAAAGPQPAMMMTALANIRAAGWSELKAELPSSPASPTSADSAASVPHSAISEAQFKKILADAETNGKTTPIPAIIATAFGLGPSATERMDGFNDTVGNIHTFTKLDNGNYILSMSGKTIAYDYYVDKNLTLISALSINPKNAITILTDKDNPQAGLDAELAFFADIANQL